jgi:hypothetical protein
VLEHGLAATNQRKFTPMIKPLKTSMPDFTGQTKMLFCSQGNPLALLITNTGGQRRVGSKKFATAEDALAWCRKNATTLVYFAVDPAFN